MRWHSPRPLLIVGLLAATSAVAGTLAGKRHWATSQATDEPEKRTAAPEPLVFVLDHAPIICRDANTPVSFEVPIANRSDGIVRFSNFACDCGCTAGRLEREGLQPGESALVRMTVNLSGREGAQRFACHWIDEHGRRWTAETRVTIYRPAQFDPATLRLGQLTAGETISRRVHYDEYATTPEELGLVPGFSISSIHRDAIQIEVSSPVIESLGVGLTRRRTSVDVSFTVANRGGYTEVFLTPTAPPGDGQPMPSVRMDWSVLETVELTPARLALTFPPKGEDRRSQVVRVRPLDGQAIVVDKITTSDPGIQARVLAAPASAADGAEIEVTVTLSEGKRFLAGDVVLHLGSLASCEVRIPVTALRGGGSGAVEGSR